MTDDRPITLSVLAKFHREVILPDIERVVGQVELRLRDEMQAGFDALAQRLDRLETEYHMLVAGLRRVEERLDAVENRLDGVEHRLDGVENRIEALTKAHERYALRSDLEDLKARVEGLQEQIRLIEERLEG